MARPRSRRRALFLDEEGINLTPLLDVIFNLIFFFVVATTIRTEETFFDLVLPSVSEGEPTQTEQVIPEVSVAEDGTMALDGTEIGAEDLRVELESRAGEMEEKRVILSADGNASVQQAADAMDIIQSAGINQVIQRMKKRDAAIP